MLPSSLSFAMAGCVVRNSVRHWASSSHALAIGVDTGSAHPMQPMRKSLGDSFSSGQQSARMAAAHACMMPPASPRMPCTDGPVGHAIDVEHAGSGQYRQQISHVPGRTSSSTGTGTSGGGSPSASVGQAPGRLFSPRPRSIPRACNASGSSRDVLHSHVRLPLPFGHAALWRGFAESATPSRATELPEELQV